MSLLKYKFIEKIPDPRNAKEHYQSFIRKKNAKAVKKSENINDVKSVITEHPQTSHKLSRTIRQTEKSRF